MVFWASMLAVAVTALAVLILDLPSLTMVSVPVAGLVTMCAVGVLGRLLPSVRSHLITMVPKFVPWAVGLVWFTGACELVGGIGLVVPQTRAAAAVGLLVLLVCVFPANVVDAHLRGSDDADVRRRVVVRGAQQAVFMALCAWVIVEALG